MTATTAHQHKPPETPATSETSGSAVDEYLGRHVRWTGPPLTATGTTYNPLSPYLALVRCGSRGVVTELMPTSGAKPGDKPGGEPEYRIVFDGGHDVYVTLPSEHIAVVKFLPDWASELYLWLPELIVVVLAAAVAGVTGIWQLAVPGIAAALWVLGNRAHIRAQNARARRDPAAPNDSDPSPEDDRPAAAGDVVDAEVTEQMEAPVR